MARYRGPVCKLCRREGIKLFLKGKRCLLGKCSATDRKSPPNASSKRRTKQSGYAVQLREKQRVKLIYGVLERPFRNYFKKAQKMKGVTGENLLILLERRLDNVLYRMGFATTRAQARNLISHGHVKVNSKKVDIPSFQVKEGDQLSLEQKMSSNHTIADNIEVSKALGSIADWIEIAEDGRSGKISRLPTRECIDIQIKEQIIVELYSR